MVSIARTQCMTKDFTPVSDGQLVTNHQGQLFIKTDPSLSSSSIEVSMFLENIVSRVVKEIQRQPTDGLITAEQAAELLKCSLATIHRLTKDCTIPSVKIGKLRRYRRSALLDLQKAETSNVPKTAR